jgi:hypothetical protein
VRPLPPAKPIRKASPIMARMSNATPLSYVESLSVVRIVGQRLGRNPTLSYGQRDSSRARREVDEPQYSATGVGRPFCLLPRGCLFGSRLNLGNLRPSLKVPVASFGAGPHVRRAYLWRLHLFSWPKAFLPPGEGLLRSWGALTCQLVGFGSPVGSASNVF